MEFWQINQISQNRPYLIQNTACNTSLLAIFSSEDVLSKEDVETIVACTTNTEKANRLYNILQTRRDGFDILLKALTETNQTGVLQVLENYPYADALQNLKISLLGKVQNLSHYLNRTQLESISSWLYATKSTDELLSSYKTLTKPEYVMSLVRDTLPEEDSFYIPRMLFQRVMLNPDVFLQNQSDVFVFKDIDRQDLRKFVGNGSIATSTSQLLEGKLTVKFVLLMSDVDWEKLCAEFNSPIHLIKFDKKETLFILEKTMPCQSGVYRHLYPVHKCKEIACISEDNFARAILRKNDTLVLICDLAGSGKSFLLGNIARKVVNLIPTYSNKVVVFIKLREFIDYIDLDHNESVCLKKLESSFLRYITTQPLHFRILSEIVRQQKIRFEIFVDELDELHNKLQLVHKFISSIQQIFPGSRIYITSRTCLRQYLEETLAVISYGIQPLSVDAQINFLTSYWSRKDSSCDSEKLCEFAKSSLKYLARVNTSSRNSLTGIPLLCRLFGEATMKQACIFADKNHVSKPSIKLQQIFANSVLPFYKSCMRVHFPQSECMFACMLKYFNGKVLCSISCKHYSYLLWQALTIVLPNFAKALSCVVSDFEGLSDEKLICFDIIVIRDENQNLKFLHRSFAELLVAEYFASVIVSFMSSQQPTHSNTRYIEHLVFNEVFMDSLSVENGNSYNLVRHTMLSYFVNAELEMRNVGTCSEYMHSFIVAPKTSQFYKVIRWSLHHNFIALLSAYLQITASSMKNAQGIKHQGRYPGLQEKVVKEILWLACKYGDVSVLDMIYQFFLRYLSTDVFSAYFKTNDLQNLSLLQMGIKRADFDIVNYLLDKIPIGNQNLVYWCLKGTYFMDKDKVDKLLDIAGLLLSKNFELINESPNSCKSLLCTPHLHIKAYNFLVEHGANILAPCKCACSILESGMVDRKASDFLEVCRFVIYECNALDLFFTKENRLLTKFLDTGNSDALIEIMIMLLQAQSGVSQNIKFNTYVFYLFLMKIKDGDLNSANLILSKFEFLLETKNEYGQTPLIFSAQCKRFEIMENLIFQGANVFTVDYSGRTVLHWVAKSGDSSIFAWIVRYLGTRLEESTTGITTETRKYNRPNDEAIGSPTNIIELFNWPACDTHITPLHYALKYIKLTVASLKPFLSCGRDNVQNSEICHTVDVHVNDSDGHTTLFYALHGEQSLEIIDYLIKCGVNKNPILINNCNLVHLCACLDLPEHLEYVLKLCCDINSLDNRGNNALQCIFENFHMKKRTRMLETIKVLLNAGINATHRNMTAQTAYDMAVSENYECIPHEIISLLKLHSTKK